MDADLVDDLTGLLAEGSRALRRDGDLLKSRRRFDAAYQAALRQGDHPAMSVAALGAAGLWVHEHRNAAGAAFLQARLRKALSLVESRSPMGLRLRARLAGEDDYRTGESAKMLAVLDEARQLSDPEVLVEALSIAHHCLLGPGHGVLRQELATELLEQSTHTMRRGDLLMGMLWQTVDLFLDADAHAERRLRELRTLLAEDNHLAVGFVADAIEVMLAIRAGDLGLAESLAHRCSERGTEAGDADAIGWHVAQLVAVRWYQGRIAELLPMLKEFVHSPALSVVDNAMFAALAVSAASSGDTRTAVGAMAKLSGRDLADLPRSSTWLVMMNGVVEAAHLLGDAHTSARAYELLSPYAELPMMASLGIACFGSVHHALGVASLTMGDPDKAVEHFRAAVQRNLALEHWPAVVASRLRHVEALGARGLPSDAAIVKRETATAAAEARSVDLPVRLAAAERELSALTVTCTRQGQSWKIEAGDRVVVLEHSVGLLHLAILVANPGQEIHSADLAAGQLALSRGGASGTLSSQPVLDRAAIQSYRNRLSDLSSEIEQLEASNDLERAVRARAERDWIVGELSAAAGLGGESRRFADGHERARIAVGKAIRRTLTRVAESDAAIGDYLRRSIHTGVCCSYRPI